MSVLIRKRKISKTKQSLYLDIHIKGNPRTRVTLGMYLWLNQKNKPLTHLQQLHNDETIKQAETIAAQRQLELQAENNGLAYVSPIKQSLHEFYSVYIKSLDGNNRNCTNFAYAKLNELLANRPFHFNQDFLTQFKNYLQTGANLKGETPRVYLRHTKRMLVAAYKKRVIKANPADMNWKMDPPKLSLIKDVLTAAELATLASTPCQCPDVKRVFLFCCNTGLRFGDAKNLTWGKIKAFNIGIQQGKTGKSVFIKLNSNAIHLAGKPGPDHQLLFPGIQTINHAIYQIDVWRKAAGISKHITTHTARHTFCTMLMQNKVDFRTIIGLMGWGQISGMRQIARYAHLVDESMKLAVDSLPKLF